MNTKLLIQTVTKFIAGILLSGLLLFVPAGTFAYWNAWLFMALLFIPMIVVGFVLLKKAPDLLSNYKDTGENK